MAMMLRGMLRSEYMQVRDLVARMLMLRNSVMEYDRHTDSYFDPFADLYNVTAPGNAFGKGY